MNQHDAQTVSRSEAPGLSVLIFELTQRDLARTVACALQNLVDPPPDALSLFEADGDDALWRVTAFYADPPDPAALRRAVEAIIAEDIPAPRLETVPDLNWVSLSQAALPPVRAGRFTVHGAHDRYRVPQGPNAILIEAGEAFGTAHHATTYGCLLAIDSLMRVRRYRMVLDLGCGSGVLAIAVARAVPSARILASDIDPGSVSVAAKNIEQNRAAAKIGTVVAAGLHHPRLCGKARYDLLIANILAGPLLMLAKAIARAVTPGGHLVLSGLLNDQAMEIAATYCTAGFALERHMRIAGWSTLVLRRVRGLPFRRQHHQI